VDEPSLFAQIAVPIISSLIGAGTGAYAAQYIVKRNKDLDDRLKEVRSTNAAVTLAYGITDRFLNEKHQIVKPLVDLFTDERQRFEDAHKPPGPRGEIRFNLDLRSYNLNRTPIEQLEEIVFNQISAPTRPMSVVSILARTIQGLEAFVQERNELIREFRAVQKAEKALDAFAYFGLVTDKGADQRYSSTLSNLADYTDDAIHFSKMIGDDLRKYAIALRDTLPSRTKPLAPIIVSADFSKRDDVMPNPEKYKDYETMFRANRVLGRGIWTAEFEALALAQFETTAEFQSA